jgi:hypothetical protein
MMRRVMRAVTSLITSLLPVWSNVVSRYGVDWERNGVCHGTHGRIH